jgi:FMN-dependent oxidoreductase (nitrilotriacetate monooxygenase family)
MFRLGWFLSTGFGVYGWNGQWSGNAAQDAGNPQLFIDAATSLERAGFDYMMLEDSSVLPDVYGGDFGFAARNAVVRLDPLPLLPLLAQATRHIGLVATVATTFYPPFLAARLMTTLDHLTRGRCGINLVTSSPDAAAQNYGLDQLPEHDQRYAMADDWVGAVNALLGSWEPGALVRDEVRGQFADPSKIHYADYSGPYYRTRGPINTIPSPQGRPVFCQAGGSPAGKEFGAKHADTIIAASGTVESMKDYREDISRRMKDFGRDPASVKVLFLCNPILADTDDEAIARRDRMDAAAAADVETNLFNLSYHSGVDFSKFELDAPVPDIRTNGHQSTMDRFMREAEGKTLREALPSKTRWGPELVGSPVTVAARMEDIMQEVGGDGFLIANPVTRRELTDVCDGLAPVLRRRGSIRDGYGHATFRENLLEA